jgi:hypothetical protein
MAMTVHQQDVSRCVIEHHGIAPLAQLKTNLETGISNSNK